jgi:hypothetical protein
VAANGQSCDNRRSEPDGSPQRPYRFFFFSSDRNERVHVHVAREGKAAKFWLSPTRVEYNYGFAPKELGRIEGLVREHEANQRRRGMSTSLAATEAATAKNVRVTARMLVVELHDGRSVSVPIDWYPRLAHGSPSERHQWELIGPGVGIHWPALDEDISVDGLLKGLASGESAESIEKWLAARGRPANKRLQPTKARRRTTAKRTSRPRRRG